MIPIMQQDGKIDKKEFLSGFSILCKGSDDEKLDLTFQVLIIITIFLKSSSYFQLEKKKEKKTMRFKFS